MTFVHHVHHRFQPQSAQDLHRVVSKVARLLTFLSPTFFRPFFDPPKKKEIRHISSSLVSFSFSILLVTTVRSAISAAFSLATDARSFPVRA